MEASFYNQDVSAIVLKFKTNLTSGLSADEAARIFREIGPNEIGQVGRRHPLKILKEQFVSPMILLLLLVISISVGIQHFIDASIISVIVLLNAWIGFFQEFRAEKAMESIRKIAAPSGRVVRDGKNIKIPAREIVPGDVVVLEAGDRIPADLRWAEAVSLQVDESLLTGESIPVFKETNALHESDLVVGDQANMGFAGSMVVKGRGVGIAVATGQNAELGRIASLLRTTGKGETPLKQKLEMLTRQFVFAAFFICLVLFGLGVFYGKPMIQMLLTSISLGVAAIPEGLPAVITISLSLGSLRLAKLGTLVRNLPAVEGLGSITVICADKTGTLTQNKMVVRYPEPSQEMNQKFIEALALCNDAESHQGDPMEVALLEFVSEKNIDPKALRSQWKRVAEIPFDTDRRRMATLHEADGDCLLYVKGAPEKILALCSEANRPALEAFQEELASRGLRVLAVAMRKVEASTARQDLASLEHNMTFLGFIGLQDPPREEAHAAIAECRSAGIRPIMITGDHPATAVAIARELGIYRDGDDVITGADLKRKSREWLDAKAMTASVFARVTPEDKLLIIQVLKDQDEIVAMTGDGVNDAPALRRADIGIAMGRGTDVAKEASSLILVKENFAAIVHAVREGRVIYDNIRKFIRYMLTTNLAEIATMLLGVAVGFPTPLLPAQILWINLVTDGLPAVALGYEPAEGNIMDRRPRAMDESILGEGLWQHVIWVGIFMGSLVIGVMGILGSMVGWEDHINLLRTVVFTSLTLGQMGHVLAIRSEMSPSWRLGLFSNMRLLGAVLITVFSQISLVYFPPFQKIFGTTRLTLYEFMICWIPAIVIFFAVEIEKWIRKRRSRCI